MASAPQAPVAKTLRGKVKWFNDAKGYGFIERDDKGKDLFVHWRGILGSGHKKLDEGDTVEFTVNETPKGPQAVNVKVIIKGE